MDFGHTEGYKKTSAIKTGGSKSFFLLNLSKILNQTIVPKNTLELSLQNVSNDKYLKLYKVKTDLVEYETDTLENSLDFSREDDDIF